MFEGIKAILLAGLAAIVIVLLYVGFLTVVGAAFRWWYITIGIGIALYYIYCLYSKYEIQINNKLKTLDKPKLIYPFISVLLLLCLFKMPYECYTIIRVITMGIFALFSYTYYQDKNEKLCFVFGTLALLFQPFVKVGLSRVTWNCIDIVLAIFILILWYKREAFIKNPEGQEKLK